MKKRMQCYGKSFINKGIYNQYFDKLAFPKINKNIVVSFKKEDCQTMNIENLDEETLDTYFSQKVPEDRVEFWSNYDGYSLEVKKTILSLASDSNYLAYFEELEQRSISYYKMLFTHINCLTSLNIQIAQDGFADRIKDDGYKIAICVVPDLRKDLNSLSISNFDLSLTPRQCLTLIDKDTLIESKKSLVLKKESLNTFGQEIFRCLGLENVTYPDMKTNIQHRSIMEDKTPLSIYCTENPQDEVMVDIQLRMPIAPTKQDICAVNSMYGYEISASRDCLEVQKTFLGEGGVSIE